MDINSLILLDKIAESGNFSRAGQAMGITKASVSNKIRQLEQDLGLRLFERSTRSVRITEDGRRIRTLVQPIIDSIREIEAVADDVVSKPKGTIRVSTSIDVGIYLLQKIIGKFTAEYPEIKIDLDLSNRYVDLLSENIDLAIRAATKPLADSDLIAVLLGGTRLKFYATPPRAKSINRHDIKTLDPECLISYSGNDVVVSSGDKIFHIKPASNIKINDMMGAKQAVLAGLGIGLLPEFACLNEIRTNLLEAVLPDWSGDYASIYAVYPSKRLMPRRTNLFLAALKQEFEAEII